jgi:hypothetical protein
MKSFVRGFMVAAALAASAAPALAQDINQRETNQQASIDDQTARMRARDNGHLTARDRRVLSHRLNHESARIYRTKHNARVG